MYQFGKRLIERPLQVSILLIIFITGVYIESRPQMVNLITANRAEIALIQQYLNQNNIEHAVVSETQIEVDESIRAETLIGLAGKGLIGADFGKTYEIFDEFSFGMTEDLFQLNNKRALQNRLGKIISDGNRNIQNAFVTISLPKNAEKAYATVKVIPIAPVSGTSISEIQSLIAEAVSGLEENDVIIFDADNQRISKNEKN